jgi:hypothetical protein
MVLLYPDLYPGNDIAESIMLVEEAVPSFCSINDMENYYPRMGYWSITGYLSSYYWYPFILLLV